MAEINETQQYLRVCKLIVYGSSNNEGLDLSNLRIKFSVKRSQVMTPNEADIIVYNIDPQSANRIGIGESREFTKVILQAGYEGNYGVIFQGNIKQAFLGRENATDTFFEILAGDGDEAYNYAIVNSTLIAGSTYQDQIEALVSPMKPFGVTMGYLPPLPQTRFPRARVLYGTVRDQLRSLSQTLDLDWSIQNGKINFVPRKSYLPGEVVLLTNNTGLIGTPQQTNEGVNLKCLLNPQIDIAGRIKLDTASGDFINPVKLNLENIALAKGNTEEINRQLPLPFTPDGIYYVYILEHTGDTRGQSWYTSLVCLYFNSTTNPLNSVSTGL